MTTRIAVGDRMHADMAVAHPQRSLQRFNNPRPLSTTDAQAILHNFQARTRTRVNARVALPFQQLEDFVLGEILRHVHRKRDDEPRIAGLPGPRLHIGINGIGRIASHRTRAATAIELRGAREQ